MLDPNNHDGKTIVCGSGVGRLARLSRATARTILNFRAIGQKAPTRQEALARVIGRKSRCPPDVHWPAGKRAARPWHQRGREDRQGPGPETLPACRGGGEDREESPAERQIKERKTEQASFSVRAAGDVGIHLHSPATSESPKSAGFRSEIRNHRSDEKAPGAFTGRTGRKDAARPRSCASRADRPAAARSCLPPACS